MKTFYVNILMVIFLCIMSMSCSSKHYVKTTEKFFSKPVSPHENLEGHDWLQLKLNNGPWVEYLKIGNKGKKILFISGILDDSIVTFSKMPGLIKKAQNGYCQLYYVNLPGNGYSSVPDGNYFNPLYLKNCLAEFILQKKLKEFSIVGNSNGCLVSVLLASHKEYGKQFKIKNILGFNPLLKEISFWEMDKYQKLLIKMPSSLVQYTIQSPFIGRKFVELTLRSVENNSNVCKEHIDLFYNRLSENYRCGIWSEYLKNTLAMMPKLKEISHDIYGNISKHTERIIFYSNSGDNWIPVNHVIEKAKEMNAEYYTIATGHIPQFTHGILVENEILKVLNL